MALTSVTFWWQFHNGEAQHKGLEKRVNMSMNNFLSKTRTRTLAATTLLIVLAIAVMTTTTRTQSFSSGSDGSDGALAIAANQPTVVFDPFDTARWGRVLDADGDGVYNFTTIAIGTGTTVVLRGDKVNRPVYWLASGSVVIDGSLNLNGNNGSQTTDLSLRRLVAIPGAGGYPGGAGGLVTCSFAVSATAGEGPGGGNPGGPCGGFHDGAGGTFAGNRYLVPLSGGSGGGGAIDHSYQGGGAGGGAILIASSTSISVSGSITAAGGNFTSGNGACSGAGSGGAIRLVAPNLLGGGSLGVGAGSNGCGSASASPGWVRLEAFAISSSLVVSGNSVTRGSPVDPSTLRPASSIRVTAINGVPVSANPSGSFAIPDVSISSTAPVDVDISASGIPPGTVVTLQVYPQSPSDSNLINLPTAQATLAGTVQASTATATFIFPYGFSRGFVRATWTP
jgi:hypothetical protein